MNHRTQELKANDGVVELSVQELAHTNVAGTQIGKDFGLALHQEDIDLSADVTIYTTLLDVRV